MTNPGGSRLSRFARIQVLPDPGAPWRPTWPFVLIAAAAFPLALLPLGVPSNPKLVTLAAVFFVIAAGAHAAAEHPIAARRPTTPCPTSAGGCARWRRRCRCSSGA